MTHVSQSHPSPRIVNPLVKTAAGILTLKAVRVEVRQYTLILIQRITTLQINSNFPASVSDIPSPSVNVVPPAAAAHPKSPDQLRSGSGQDVASLCQTVEFAIRLGRISIGSASVSTSAEASPNRDTYGTIALSYSK